MNETNTNTNEDQAMQYAATVCILNVEEVAVVLPRHAVPAFDPDNPPPNAYLVHGHVQQGWIKREDGKFYPPSLEAVSEFKPLPESIHESVEEPAAT